MMILSVLAMPRRTRINLFAETAADPTPADPTPADPTPEDAALDTPPERTDAAEESTLAQHVQRLFYLQAHRDYCSHPHHRKATLVPG